MECCGDRRIEINIYTLTCCGDLSFDQGVEQRTRQDRQGTRTLSSLNGVPDWAYMHIHIVWREKEFLHPGEGVPVERVGLGDPHALQQGWRDNALIF